MKNSISSFSQNFGIFYNFLRLSKLEFMPAKILIY